MASPIDIQTNMSDEISPSAAESLINSAQISAADNAEAKNKTAIWADKIDTETTVILESMMENYES